MQILIITLLLLYFCFLFLAGLTRAKPNVIYLLRVFKLIKHRFNIKQYYFLQLLECDLQFINLVTRFRLNHQTEIQVLRTLIEVYYATLSNLTFINLIINISKRFLF